MGPPSVWIKAPVVALVGGGRGRFVQVYACPLTLTRETIVAYIMAYTWDNLSMIERRERFPDTEERYSQD